MIMKTFGCACIASPALPSSSSRTPFGSIVRAIVEKQNQSVQGDVSVSVKRFQSFNTLDLVANGDGDDGRA
jgi:hypothetical protein